MLTVIAEIVLVLVNITVRRYWISLLKSFNRTERRRLPRLCANGGLRCCVSFQSMAPDSIVMIEQWESSRTLKRICKPRT